MFGVLDAGIEGAYAEKLAIKAAIVARKPDRLSHLQAAAMALTGITAIWAIEDTAQLLPGETILIEGGAGGVAGFAIQLAKYLGATVITTTSAANVDYVRTLGPTSQNPARLDGDGEQLDRCVGDQVGEVVFVLGSSAMFADQPGFVPGICWPRMSRMLCDGPSATRTRTAGKRVDSRRLVPRRQLTERQDAPPRIASAAIDLRKTETPATMPGLSILRGAERCVSRPRQLRCFVTRRARRSARSVLDRAR